MIKTSRILQAQVFYHGQSRHRNPRGGSLYLTPNPAYASNYSGGGPIEVYEITAPMNKIFTLRKVNDMDALQKSITDDQIWKSITNASSNGELDWAAYHNIANDQYDDASQLLKSLGYRGVWLSERPGIKSVLLFNAKDATKIGEEPAQFRKV